jgi:superfamily II RNA helicase
LILNLIEIGENDYIEFVRRSMIQNEIDKQEKTICLEIENIKNEIHKIESINNNLKTPLHLINEFIELQNNSILFSNKKRKELDKNIKKMIESNFSIEKDATHYNKYLTKIKELEDLQNKLKETNNYLVTKINNLLIVLDEQNLIQKLEINGTNYTLTSKGKIACHLREVNSLLFSELIYKDYFNNLNIKELIGIFSCFTNISVPQDKKCIHPNSKNNNINELLNLVIEKNKLFQDLEQKYEIHSGLDYNIHFDLIDYVIEWSECINETECKILLQKIQLEKELSLGEFIKAILKINNIVNELEKVFEITGNIKLLNLMTKIPESTLKYVATTQSLYV